MKRKEIDFPSLPSAAPPSSSQRAVPATSGAKPALAAVSSMSAKECLLRVPAGKFGLLVECMAKVCNDRVLEAIMQEFEAMEAEEQRRSLTSRLPEELLCDVLEFTMERVEEIGPLSLVSKAFGHCVKLPQMLERVALKVPEEMLQDCDSDAEELDEEVMDEKRALLEVFLRRAGEQCPGLDSGIQSLARLTALRSLDVEGSQITHAGPLASMTALEELNLSNCLELTDEGLRALSSLQHLQCLSLSGNSQLTGEGLQFLPACLKRLDLYFCRGLTDASLEGLPRLLSLQELILGWTNFGDADVIALSSLVPSLTKLDLRSCKSITDAGFSSLSSLSSLQDLNVCLNNIGDTGIRAVSSFPSLIKLDLSSCTSITDAEFSSLSALTLLKVLNLGWTNIGDAGVRAVSSIPSLARIDLNRCMSITDAGFSSLSSLSSLKDLNVCSTHIGDAGVRAVSSIPSLTKLNLISCNSSTDAGFSSLPSPAALEELDARHTNIGTETARTLRTALNSSARLYYGI